MKTLPITSLPDGMVDTPWGPSESLHTRKLHPGPGTPAEEVSRNQRERLFGAMVAGVAERGFSETRIADLVEVAGLSRNSFYALFPDKESCFIAALEAMVSTGFAYASAATAPSPGGRGTWRDQVTAVVAAFAQMVVAQPAAARMLLLGVHAAGPAALSHLDTAFEGFEALGDERRREHPELVGLPDEVITAVTGAVQEIARTRLREHREDQMPRLVPALADLIASYPPPPEPLRLTTRPPAFAPETIDAHDRGERAIRAFTAVVAERGYANTTITEIVKRASMSPTTFYANFGGKEGVLMAAIDSVGAQTLAATIPAFRRNPDWAHGIRAAFGAFFNFLASRPALARLMLVEVYAAGPQAMKRREDALAPLAALLGEGHARAPDVTPLAAEAIAGGVIALSRKQIRDTGPEDLPQLAPISTYLTLAPFIGAEAACRAANGSGLPQR
jgi:AcrR family transcriptional regulator